MKRDILLPGQCIPFYYDIRQTVGDIASEDNSIHYYRYHKEEEE